MPTNAGERSPKSENNASDRHPTCTIPLNLEHSEQKGLLHSAKKKQPLKV